MLNIYIYEDLEFGSKLHDVVVVVVKVGMESEKACDLVSKMERLQEKRKAKTWWKVEERNYGWKSGFSTTYDDGEDVRSC